MSYNPDERANPSGRWATAFLSTRDLALSLPVNFVPKPGVTLTSACFSDGQYEDKAVARCFSNLLAARFERFVIDLYWDTGRMVWSLCPMKVPVNEQGKSAVATKFKNGSNVYSLGPYECTATIDFKVVLAVLSDYLETTSTTLKANLIYLSLNLHASGTTAATDDSRSTLDASDFTSTSSVLSDLINVNLSSSIYTPDLLRQQRADLEDTWGSTGFSDQRDRTYFTTNGNRSPDGWPSESYIELSNNYRLLIEIGEVDDRIQSYHNPRDNKTIFPSSYLSDSRPTTQLPSGEISSGCIFDPAETSVTAVNNSWALTPWTLPASHAIQGGNMKRLLSNLSACGISPLLSTTMGKPAHIDPLPYLDYTQSFLWSWAEDQPTVPEGNDTKSLATRCAALDILDTGRWTVHDCRASYRAACWDAHSDSPYKWRLSSSSHDYIGSTHACEPGHQFRAPRTALENSYLQHTAEQGRAGPGSLSQDRYVWVNLNAFDHIGCWVEGINATCPYQSGPLEDSRTVIIPTVAAIIVFILALLTFLVKCAANRRNSRRRRRRRGSGGWNYEGVPS